jgi:hypothetical protein
MIRFDRVTIDERDVAYKGKITKSVCLVIDVYATDDNEVALCGYLGEMIVHTGNIDVARKLQSVFEKELVHVQNTPTP